MPEPSLEGEPGWTEVRPFPFAAARRTFTADEREKDRLKIRYFRREPDRALAAKVWFGPRSEGAPGFVHGGGLLTALDEAMGAAAWVLGYPVMTIRLQTTFRRPVPVGMTLTILTTVERVRGRSVEVAGRMVDVEGRVSVEAEGSFVRLAKKKVEAIFGGAK